MIGDMPLPLPPLLGWRWPRGPFIIPVRISASPISASSQCLPRVCLFVRNEDEGAQALQSCARALRERGRRALRPTARRRRGRLGGHARIADDAIYHESVPDKQHDERPEGCADETCALIEPVPADGLADEGGDESAGDSQRSGKDEALRFV